MMVLLHSGGSKGPSMTMDHMVGRRTPTIMATSFTPSLGGYVFFPSSPLYIAMLVLIFLECIVVIFCLQFEKPKNIYICVASCSLILTKTQKTKNIFVLVKQ
jgi:hypothetical protein